MPKVFLSYRHENDPKYLGHQANVRQLGEKLRGLQIEVVLDQFYHDTHPGGPDEQWPKWCEDQIPNADKVLMVASAGYFRCYEQTETPKKGLGAACETTVIRNILYECRYISDKFRFVYFDDAHLEKMPIALNGIHKFNTNDPDDLKDLIAWIGGSTPTNIAPPPIAQTLNIIWPTAIQNYEPDLANRNVEFDFFRKMLAGNTTERAVFFEAPSNHGKTGLLNECKKYSNNILQPKTCVAIDFKVNPSKESMLETFRMDLAGILPCFSTSTGNAGELRQGLRLNVSPILFVFDTYEKSSFEARELILTLLSDLEKCASLVIIIAGQCVPDHDKALWASFVRYYHLGPITNLKYWHNYAEKHYPKLKPEHIEAVTSISGGIPGTQITNFMAVNSLVA